MTTQEIMRKLGQAIGSLNDTQDWLRLDSETNELGSVKQSVLLKVIIAQAELSLAVNMLAALRKTEKVDGS